jgi:hypothetical protein
MNAVRNILAAFFLAAFGVFALRTYAGPLGLSVGGLSVLGALCIAFPTQMNDVGPRVKNLLVLLIPVVKGALPGGDRKTDPKADGTPKDGAS